MADLYVAMYAPLVGNHEHWNLQVVIRNPHIIPRTASPASVQRGSIICTRHDPASLRNERKRKRSSSPCPIESIPPPSSDLVDAIDHDGRTEAVTVETACGLDLCDRCGKPKHAPTERGRVSTVTTIYEVLNQHPDFVACVTTTTAIGGLLDSTSSSALSQDVAGDVSAVTSAPSRMTGEDPTMIPPPPAPTTPTSPLPFFQNAQESICSPAVSPESGRSPFHSSPSPSPLPNQSGRPPLRRLIHLSPLNLVDLCVLDTMVRAIKVDNETVHWNCQDYVLEMLEGLEEGCVVDSGFDGGEEEEETEEEENSALPPEGTKRMRRDKKEWKREIFDDSNPSSYYTRKKKELFKWFGPII